MTYYVSSGTWTLTHDAQSPSPKWPITCRVAREHSLMTLNLRLQNDLLCVEWDVNTHSWRSISVSKMTYYVSSGTWTLTHDAQLPQTTIHVVKKATNKETCKQYDDDDDKIAYFTVCWKNDMLRW